MAAKRPAKAASKKSAKKASAPKSDAKKPAARKAPAKAAVKKAAAKKPAGKAAFGRSGTAGKAEGDAGVRAFLDQLPAQQRAMGETIDAIVASVVPDVKRAVKWSMPFYGREGQGWFCAFAAFKGHCAVRFFRGMDLKPVPPEGSSQTGRSVKYRAPADIDEAQLRAWVEQAAALPGWGG